ncbi:MAG: hypothetical protein ACOY94_09765 [Bacillota bacterium]
MQPASPAPAAKRPLWHGLTALILGLLSVPVALFGVFLAVNGFAGLFLLSGSIAFVGLMLGAYALFTGSTVGRILGGLAVPPALGVIWWVLSIYG